MLIERKIKYLSLSEWCFDVLKKAILSGELEPGEQLKEFEIAKRLNVSRSPVRDAVQRLISEGLAEKTPQKGVKIINCSSEDVIDLMKVREVLECLLVRELCKTLTDDEIEFGRKKLIELLRGSYKQKDLEYPQEEFDFHDYLMNKTKNPFLFSALNLISNKVKLLRFRSGALLGREEDAINEHLKILDLIRNDKPDSAENLIRLHIAKAKENILNLILQKQSN